jgi:hypothetical protein
VRRPGHVTRSFWEVVVGRVFVHVKALAFRPAGVMMLTFSADRAAANIHDEMKCEEVTGVPVAILLYRSPSSVECVR